MYHGSHGFWMAQRLLFLPSDPDKFQHIAAGAHRRKQPFVISQQTVSQFK